jgi:hypothetical protein
MVRDVFTQEAIARLIGGMGIGHGEYFFLLSSHRLSLNFSSVPNAERGNTHCQELSAAVA